MVSEGVNHDEGMDIDDSKKPATTLTKIENLSDNMFEGGEDGGINADTVGVARQILEIYQLEKESMWLHSENRVPREGIRVLDKVKITPVDSEGRYMVSFSTTEPANGTDKLRILANSFLFDLSPSESEIEHTKSEEDRTYLVGKKDGEIGLIGKHVLIKNEIFIGVPKKLQEQGWENITKVWPADLNRFGGFTENTEN